MSPYAVARTLCLSGCPMVPWREGPLRSPSRALRTLEEMEDFASVPYWARVIDEGHVVLDWDDGLPPPAELPPSTTLRTRRGWHMWFTSSAEFTKHRLPLFGREVDVCPAGTLERVAGKGFEFTAWVDPVPLPALVEAALSVPREAGGLGFPSAPPQWVCPSYVGDPERYMRKVAVNIPTQMRQAVPGQRNNTLNRLAFMLALLGDAAKPLDWERLAREAMRTGLGAEEVYATIASAQASVYGKPMPPAS